MTFEVRAPSVICEDLDGEVIAIDLEVGRYYRLTGQSRQVWAWLAAGIAPEDIASACTDTAGADGAVEEFVHQLLDFGLIRATDAVGGPEAPGSWDLEPLEFEMFSDLEDILGLDPIHEVDPERGWPYPMAE